MKKALVVCLLTIHSISYAQINSLQDESQYLFSLHELVSQSFTEHYTESDWEEPWRQHFEFDPMSMNLVFYKTPYDEEDNGKLPTAIKWLVKSVIPLHGIDTLTGDYEKNTITIRTKDGKSSVQVYALAPDPVWSGSEYYPAAQETEIVIQSDKLLKIRNLEKRLNGRISELQNFHARKMDLVNYLNKKLRQEVAYQMKDTLHYPTDRKFKVIQEFQLDSSGQWLSIVVERKNYYGNPLTEKQTVRLRDITEVGKDFSVMLKTSEENRVIKTTTVINDKAEKRVIETVDTLFFLQLWYEKNNEHIGSEMVNLFRQIGQNIQQKDWYD